MKTAKKHINQLLIAPFVLIQGTFLVSLATILIYSFCNLDAHGNVVYKFTLENYQRLFFDITYLQVFGRSLALAGLTTFSCLVLGYPVAYFLARSSDKIRRFLLVALILPFSANFLIRTYAWIFILRTGGLLETVTSALQLPIPDLLFSSTAVMIGLVYNYLIFMILPIYAVLYQFDFRLLEAAANLGANKLRAFFTITLPLSRNGILTGCGLVFIPSLGEFIIPDLLGGARSIMIGNVIKMQFLEARNWPFGAAFTASLVLSLLLIVGFFRLVSALRTSNAFKETP